ncbi:uncharacterized protein CcaverHIS019_0601290 [Cutaneotrichosporon cavernicola]|uniref:PIN domain-containing protein n=1 Tax=Cutaneotrichosporon cavernicola TaxID=279322 RepID=A0AA48L841_9TREE|nr:uncharacterized protein CcaverHIS019_0601290 [Cutaneotrichosporon cavernicola]BEI93670.1 hypothetical protein CcaverHIS019_0601290 [Cutaneotrichosporon cavernicola]
MDWEPNGHPVHTFPSSSTFQFHASRPNGSGPTGPSSNGAKLFLALDTNVLIDQLQVVSDLHARLVSRVSDTWILVGQQAINELDGLSKSSKPDLAISARAATSWLHTTARAPQIGRTSRLRLESRAERSAAAIAEREGVGISAREDDAVLSCCLWFQRIASVRLWTHDRNLAVLAEGSGVHTLVGRAGLLRLLREAGVERDANEGMELDEEIMDAEEDPFPTPFPTERTALNADRVAELVPHLVQPQPLQQHAYTPWVPRSTTPSTSTSADALEKAWVSAPSRRRSSSANASSPTRPTAPLVSRHNAVLPPPGALAEALRGRRPVDAPTSTYHSSFNYPQPTAPPPPRPSSEPNPTNRISSDLDALLVNTLAPASTLLEVVDAPNDALGHARAIATRLNALDTQGQPVDRRRGLFHALANAQTLASFLAGERVRPGEAADGLLVLAEELERFIPLDRNAWSAVAERLRLHP